MGARQESADVGLSGNLGLGEFNERLLGKVQMAFNLQDCRLDARLCKHLCQLQNILETELAL